MSEPFDLSQYGIRCPEILRNAPVARLYEEAILYDKGSAISNAGALVIRSGEKTGRSPRDKRIADNPRSSTEIWWGEVNIRLDEGTFYINRERAIDYFNILDRIYVFDGFAGWDPKYRLRVRIVCTRPYHALFMQNMLIRPSAEELAEFGEPDYVVMNAGGFPANRHTSQMSSKTSVSLNLEQREFVILGTEYAGEMKKGIFTIMHYIMPKQDVFSMHCSANEGDEGDVSLFFGLSGTGKTTLSADPRRKLIGDDEHCWTSDGIFNVEGGCYAKAINLTSESEPEIYNAIRFGTVLENVVYDPGTRIVNFDDSSITENTRASYPIEFIENAKIPCVGGHPSNIILLTCDAFGVLPPVTKLTPAQAMYHFISGYTAKVAGTEQGVTEPVATFSACFGAAFLVWHPSRYAELLAEKMQKHSAHAWLVNTGWSGGGYDVGQRIRLRYTRAIIDAIHSGALLSVPVQEDPIFGLQIPMECPEVPSKILLPRDTWAVGEAYDQAAKHLADLFDSNFESYRKGCSREIVEAGPRPRVAS